MPKTNKRPAPIYKPHLPGDPVEKESLKAAAVFLLGTLGMALVSLLVGGILNLGMDILRIGMSVLVLLVIYMAFYRAGAAQGAQHVTHGEILHNRKETGRSVPEWERKMCFHPLKGFITALIGSVPLFVCAVLLSCTATLQQTSYGALPSWVSGMPGRAEVTQPLAYYTTISPMTVEDITRLIVRAALMPIVNLVGAENKLGLLLFDRLSPILTLIPAACYGLGYLSGPRERALVHAGIEAGKQRQQKQERKRLKQKQGQRSQPPQKQQLN